MTPAFIDNPLYFCWPFWVLEITPEAKNADIEKAAREITTKIQFDVPDAEKYLIPGGVEKRDEFLIREAKSRLQDPKARLIAEYWYIAPDEIENASNNEEKISAEDWYKGLGVRLWGG